MKITLFGATGKIGRLLLDIALQNGDDVTVYVRNPEKLPTHTDLKIVIGELADTELIERAVINTDIVISTLGPVLDTSRTWKGTPIADGHEVIINAMKKHNRKRIISLATPSLKSDDDGFIFSTIVPPKLARLFYPNAYNDMKQIGYHIRQSALDWTVVRIIFLVPDQPSKEYAISLGNTKAGMAVSRGNVAAFIYKVAKENLYIRKMPIVFNT
jgi:putative NADH-flavin reductase